MADDFTWMLGMHRIAAQYGDGLKPELVEALQEFTATTQNVVPLQVSQRSAGPAFQNVSASELASDRILQLPTNSARSNVRPEHSESGKIPPFSERISKQ